MAACTSIEYFTYTQCAGAGRSAVTKMYIYRILVGVEKSVHVINVVYMERRYFFVWRWLLCVCLCMCVRASVPIHVIKYALNPLDLSVGSAEYQSSANSSTAFPLAENSYEDEKNTRFPANAHSICLWLISQFFFLCFYFRFGNMCRAHLRVIILRPTFFRLNNLSILMAPRRKETAKMQFRNIGYNIISFLSCT